MGERHTTMYCHNCKQQTAAIQPTANHVLHLLVTLLACGFWIPVWILCALFPGPKRCASCGLTSIGSRFVSKSINGVAVVMALLFGVVAYTTYTKQTSTPRSSVPVVPVQADIAPSVPGADHPEPSKVAASATEPEAKPETQPEPTAPPVKDKSAVGRGFSRGENDLEGRTDSTPQKPIIEAAEKALKKYLKGKVQISDIPTVKIIEADKSWLVIGKYDSPVDKRHDFQSIIRLNVAGKYEAGHLLLDDDVVMDKILSEPKPAPKRAPEPAPVRTWTSTSGKFTVDAAFVSRTGDKVKLKKTDGTTITVDAEKLSEDDRQWLKDRSAK